MINIKKEMFLSNFKTIMQSENNDLSSKICALNLINPKEILNFIQIKKE